MKKFKLFMLFSIALFFSPSIVEAQLLKNLKEISKTVKELRNGKKEDNDVVLKDTKTESEDEIVLTVSADGSNKDEAIKIALRSAIEQAYGTFVSANTTILNDELVKDEIVTVASGNIKEYKEIASETMGDKTFVTLQAKVCISKLVSYAQSKGAETEFAGATFAMNMRMKELNKKSEETALKNLASQIISMYSSAFSYKLSIDEPRLLKNNFSDIIDPSDIGLVGNYEDYYYCGLNISIEYNSLMDNIENLIINTFNSLALSDSEVEEYRKHDIEYYICGLFDHGSHLNYELHKRVDDKIKRLCSPNKYTASDGHWAFRLRSDYKPIFVAVNEAIGKILHSFRITDNNGNFSTINQWKLVFVTGNDLGIIPISGEGLLFPYAKRSLLSQPSIGDHSNFYISRDGINLFYNTQVPLLCPFIFIPKNEIHKFSNFSIEVISPDSITFDDERKLLERYAKLR